LEAIKVRHLSATLLLLMASPALAGGRGPVCREPTVIDEISREVRAENYYARVDPRLVTEQPTTDPRVVRCDVCVLSAPYNTIRFGDRPIASCQAHRFDVMTMINGFVVQPIR
jgi:hypothetical protein